jgi:hypothetical protein
LALAEFAPTVWRPVLRVLGGLTCLTGVVLVVVLVRSVGSHRLAYMAWTAAIAVTAPVALVLGWSDSVGETVFVASNVAGILHAYGIALGKLGAHAT